MSVDGVLNSQELYVKLHDEGKSTFSGDMELQKKSIELVAKLAKEFDAKVVISSTWRMGYPNHSDWKNLEKQLGEYGISIFGRTPVLWERRGIEIQKYIDELENKGETIENFVIIDDDMDMEHLINHLAKTDFKYGFIESNYEKAVKILKGEI